MNLAIPLDRINAPAQPLPMSALSAEALIGEGRRQGKEERMDASVPVAESEAPWHMHLANYLAMGMSQKDAARELGVSEQQVSRVIRAPWFAERLAIRIREGQMDIMSLFRGAALGAYATLVEVCENPKISPAVRVSAAKELLERHLGKSTQFVEVKSQSSEDPVEKVARLEAEAAKLRAST